MPTHIPAEDFVTGIPVALSPGDIERELASMWSARADSCSLEDRTQSHGVTRVVLANVLWLGSSRHVSRIRQAFSRLVSDFPCRLLLIEYFENHEGTGIDAFINAHCFLSTQVQGEVCCEEIHLRFGKEGMPHLKGAILPLLVSDVPSCLWLSSTAPEQYGRILEDLTAIVDRVFWETAQQQNPAEGLGVSLQSQPVREDLSWFRLAPVREHIASVFDDPGCGNLLEKITRVEIRWQDNQDLNQRLVPASLLVGWLASRLGWTPGEVAAQGPYRYMAPHGKILVSFALKPDSDAQESNEHFSLELRFAQGECIRLEAGGQSGQMERTVAGTEGSCASTRQLVRMEEYDDARALGRALNFPSESKAFEAAAKAARRLLQSAQSAGGLL